MIKTEQLNELAAALATAQGQIENATKDATNPFFKKNYADLASVRAVIKDPFAKNGLSYVQILGNAENCVTVETVLLHKSGQYISGTLAVHPVKDDPQALGSAVTYARRYALQAIAGIATEDDDGEAAMARNGHPDGGKAQQSAPRQPTHSDSRPAPVPVDRTEGELFIIGTVEGVSFKEGVKNGKPWARYGVKIKGDERYFNTFDKKLGMRAEALKTLEVKLIYKNGAPYNGSATFDLLAFDEAPKQEGSQVEEQDAIPF